jgi:Tfp pilus assembly protein FimT
MTIAALLAGMAVPVTANAIDSSRARYAAGFVASRLRLARQQAVFKTRSVGVVFQQTATGRWRFRICVDGNGNGIRRAETVSGKDPCSEGPYDLTEMFTDVAIAVDPTLAGPEGSAASPNPVRFGSSQIASFSPAGSCTAGTVYLRSRKGVQYAIRVGNVSGRTRILRYETGSRRWIDG